MPVWHERTKKAVAAGRLKVLGITQEQHPDRCRLFCRWKGIDWPILWDPFNLTGSKAVPHFRFVDEHGVVRARRARTDDLEAFLDAAFPAPAQVHRPTKGPRDVVVEALGNEPTANEWHRLSDLLWGRTADPGALIDALVAGLGEGPVIDAGHVERLFRLGVAHRMRHDSAFQRPGDFQAALDAWSRALALRPEQYIWRRRIQQFGPRPDKPYPFYAWVERAGRDLRARGEPPPTLRAPLSETERSAWGASGGGDEEPDPDGRVPRAEGGTPLLLVESAVAWDTSGRSRAGRLHLRLRPADAGRATWNPDGPPLVAWIAVPVDGDWRVAPRRLEVALPPGPDDDAGSVAPVTVECEVVPPSGAQGRVRLRGYVLAPVCRASDGACLVLRQDFELDLTLPRPRPR